MNDDTAMNLGQLLFKMFSSNTFADMLKLHGTSHGDAPKWPSDPENFGVDLSAKQDLTDTQRQEYDFWREIENKGFKVSAVSNRNQVACKNAGSRYGGDVDCGECQGAAG